MEKPSSEKEDIENWLEDYYTVPLETLLKFSDVRKKKLQFMLKKNIPKTELAQVRLMGLLNV